MTLVLGVTSVPLLMYIIFPLAPREPCAAVQMSEIAASDTLTPYRPLITGDGVLVHGYRR